MGGALHNSPFAPRIPCRRVIASNHLMGGFKGEWAASSAVAQEDSNDEGNDAACLLSFRTDMHNFINFLYFFFTRNFKF